MTTTRHQTDEAEIRQHIDTLVQAIRDADLDAVKPIFAPDMVSFDIVPPLRHVAAAAKWRNWADLFTVYQRPLGYEVRDLAVTVGMTSRSRTASTGSAARCATEPAVLPGSGGPAASAGSTVPG